MHCLLLKGFLTPVQLMLNLKTHLNWKANGTSCEKLKCSTHDNIRCYRKWTRQPEVGHDIVPRIVPSYLAQSIQLPCIVMPFAIIRRILKFTCKSYILILCFCYSKKWTYLRSECLCRWCTVRAPRLTWMKSQTAWRDKAVTFNVYSIRKHTIKLQFIKPSRCA